MTGPVVGAVGDAPSPSSYDVSVDAWTLVPPEPSAACAADAWVPLDVGPVLEMTTDAGEAAVGLRASNRELLAIGPGDIAFLRYRTTVGAFAPGGPATAWLNAWSFDADDVAVLVTDPPSVFPALNLTEFSRILENAMGEQVAGQTIAYGSMLLSME